MRCPFIKTKQINKPTNGSTHTNKHNNQINICRHKQRLSPLSPTVELQALCSV